MIELALGLPEGKETLRTALERNPAVLRLPRGPGPPPARRGGAMNGVNGLAGHSTRDRRSRAAGLILTVLLPGVVLPVTAVAHPLGNFSVNRYDGLRLRPDRIQDSLVLDTAEIPTAQDRTAADRDHDGAVDAAEAADRAGQRCAELAGAVRADIGGREASWRVEASSLAYGPGAAGLPTARLSCELSADADLTRPVRVAFHSGADGARPGWKEITAVGEGVELREGSVPRRSATDGLRSYPADSVEQPLSVVAVELAADGASAALPPPPAIGGSAGDGASGDPADGASAAPPADGSAPAPDGAPAGRRSVPGAHRSAERRAVPAGAVGLPPLDGVERHLAALTTTRDLTVPVGLAATALALLLGAGHAALPGHAKLAVAACLARTSGRPRRGGLRSALAVGGDGDGHPHGGGAGGRPAADRVDHPGGRASAERPRTGRRCPGHPHRCRPAGLGRPRAARRPHPQPRPLRPRGGEGRGRRP
ncbi:hypothetical protein [Kitasatospora albolonga]|uniref:hypothetical protein n=1 Tax=Kitasatospora albolonga TaxID=68173 RepID=UPI0031EFFAE9